MTEIKEEKKQDDLTLSFHNWRHNDVITQKFFKFLELESQMLSARLANLSQANTNQHDLLMQLGGISAVVRFIDIIKSISFEDIQLWSSENEKA